MDVRYINAFVGSVKHVFKTMMSMDVSLGKPAVVTDTDAPALDVSAVVGISGDAMGRVVLGFSKREAASVASRFAGTELTPQHPDFADAIGELANMVSGYAKSKLDGLNCSISLPSVVVGEGHCLSHSRSKAHIIVPCTSECGAFSLEVCLIVLKN